MSVMEIFWVCFFTYVFSGVVLGFLSTIILEDHKLYKECSNAEQIVINVWFGVFWGVCLLFLVYVGIKIFFRGFPLSLQVYKKFRQMRQKEILERKRQQVDDLMKEIENLKTLGE